MHDVKKLCFLASRPMDLLLHQSLSACSMHCDLCYIVYDRENKSLTLALSTYNAASHSPALAPSKELYITHSQTKKTNQNRFKHVRVISQI